MMPEERTRAGRAVEQRLYERSLSPTALAAQAHVDPKTVRGLVTGRTWPTQDVRLRIEVALGCQLGDLIRIALGAIAASPQLTGYTDAELLADQSRITAELQRRCAIRERQEQLGQGA